MFLACSPAPKAPANECLVKSEIVFHGDPAFSPEQRAEIEASFKRWEEFSGGVVRLSVNWGIDFENISEQEWYLLSVTSDNELVKQWDSPDASLLGLTKRNMIGGFVFLVVDRLPAEMFKAVALHEFGHAIGLDHLNQPGQLMSPSYTRGLKDFTTADRRHCVARCLCRNDSQ